MALIDLTGQRFGRLVVSGRGANSKKQTRWYCTCDCGTERLVMSSHLRSGHTVSCGCFHREQTGKVGRTHGESHRTPEYSAWAFMICRCNNRQQRGYKHYGGRGITVCAEWQQSYPAFLAYVGRRPTPRHSIDRIDNNGNYEPGNVRWATRQQQNLNQRRQERRTVGVRFLSSCPNRPWIAVCAKQYLGAFATEDEAIAAYQSARQQILNSMHSNSILSMRC